MESRPSFFSKKVCPNDSTHNGNNDESQLSLLRDNIKNVMIPLLIKVFEMKLAAQQTKMPPSRLQKNPAPDSLAKIREQLEQLLQNVNLLSLWCESAQKQIIKAIKETEETAPSSFHQMAPSFPSIHPAIEKSFSETFGLKEREEKVEEKKKNWFKKIFHF
jgi:hypothetical protein